MNCFKEKGSNNVPTFDKKFGIENVYSRRFILIDILESTEDFNIKGHHLKRDRLGRGDHKTHRNVIRNDARISIIEQVVEVRAKFLYNRSLIGNGTM